MTKSETPAERLPISQTLAYGAGNMANQIFDSGIGYIVFYVFNIALGVNPFLVGLAQSLARGVDLLTDPLSGYLSDSLRYKIGLRYFLALGASVGGIFFALIWLFPLGLSPPEYFVWLIVCFSVTAIGWSFFSVPRGALGFEMTHDPYERTKLMTIAGVMAIVCNLSICWAYAGTQLPLFGGTINGARWIGGAMGGGIIVFGMISAFGCRGGEPIPKTALSSNERSRVPGLRDFAVAFKRVMKSQAFVLLTGAISLMVIGLVSTLYGVGPCLVIYHVYGGSQAKASILLGAGNTAWLVTGLIFSAPVLWLSRRIGKKPTLLAFLFVALIGGGFKWIFYDPARPWLAVIPFSLFGCGTGALAALAPSMVADACDLEESVSGARDSGMFSAFYYWSNKLGTSIGMAVTGIVLNLTGFSAAKGEALSHKTIIEMKIVDSAIPSLTILVGMIMIFFYPITIKQMEAVRALLEKSNAPPATPDGLGQI
jgi:glycoside/pentoside/hexuronide:cation symporter, GPH family